MHNLASVDKNNCVGRTSCCNAPIKTSNTGEFFVCKCCGTEVTLVPEFAELSPQEKLMKQKAIANKNKAKEVSEDILDHLAKLCIIDYVELIEAYCQEQFEAYIDLNIEEISAPALVHFTNLAADKTKQPSAHELKQLLLADPTYTKLMFNYTIGELSTKTQVDKHALAQRVLELEKDERYKKALNDYIQS
jgi:hypothetical protein